MKLFDTHTHLNADQFTGMEDQIVAAAKEAGVLYMAVVGFDQATIAKSLELSKTYDHIISVIGCHPTEAETYDQAFEAALIEQLQEPKVKMLGEIGLDYYWDRAHPDTQKRVFRRQIAIAKEMGLPITIHNREASQDTYKILKEEGVPAAGGIMHSFGGDPEEAKAFLDLGMHLSFSGVLTFKKSEALRQAAALAPADKILIETDAPYLAPVPYRGKQNQPAYLVEVAKVLANVRGLSLEELADLTTRNAFNLFRWEP